MLVQLLSDISCDNNGMFNMQLVAVVELCPLYLMLCGGIICGFVMFFKYTSCFEYLLYLHVQTALN